MREKFRGLFTFFALTSIVIMLFSPLLAWSYSLLFLTLGSAHINKTARRIFGFMVVLSGTIMAVSREHFVIRSDDFDGYYWVYESLSSGITDVLYSFSGGLEISLPLYLLFLSKISPSFSPTILMFLISFPTTLLFFYWLEKYAFIYLSASTKGIGIASSLVFFSNFATTQVIRQMVAMVILLFVINNHSKFKSLLLLILAASFHLTAIPIYIITKLVSKYEIKALIVILGSLFIGVLFFTDILALYSSGGLDFAGSSKLDYYARGTSEYTSSIAILPYLLLVVILYIFFVKKDTLAYQYKYFVLTFVGLYLIFWNIPLASIRVTLIFSYILYGYVVFLGALRIIDVYKYILAFYIIYKSIKHTQPVGIGYDLWTQYDWIGFPMGYFLY